MFNLTTRISGGVLGGIGILSLLSGAIDLATQVQRVVDAYQNITHPIWGFLFDWFFDWIGLTFPTLLKDYLSMGSIVTFAAIRTGHTSLAFNKYDGSSDILIEALRVDLLHCLGLIITWPVIVFNALSVILGTTIHDIIDKQDSTSNTLGHANVDYHIFGSVKNTSEGTKAAEDQLRAFEINLAKKYGEDVYGLFWIERKEIMERLWVEEERSNWRALLRALRKEENKVSRKSVNIFFEFVIWAFGMICISYGLLLV